MPDTAKPRRYHIIANAALGPYISGGDRHFIELAKYLLARQNTVLIYVWEEGRTMCLREGLPAASIVVWPVGIWSKSGFLITYLARIINGALQAPSGPAAAGEKNIVISASDFWQDVLPAFIWKMRKRDQIAWVAYLHLLAPDPRVWFSAQNIFFKISQLVSVFLMRRSDRVFVVNNDIKKYVARRGLARDKVIVVDNGIHLREIREIAPLYHVKKYDAIFSGRFHPQKGIFDLLRIWKMVVKRNKDAKLGLIGSGSKAYRSKVIRAVKDARLEAHVELLGFKGRAEQIALMKTSRMFVFPSTHESWGIVVAEAMASGVPVVAYNLGFLKDIFRDGIYLVPLKDSDGFADTIVNILSHPDEAEITAQKALRIVEQYDWEKVLSRTVSHMEGVIR